MDPHDRLMVRYRRGDVRAFEELYERWERRAYGFCLHYLGDPDRAADAFQDTFRRLVESRDRYEPEGRFASWLFTLARRACIDLVRAERPHRREERTDAALRESVSASRTSSPEKEVVVRSELDRLLARLPASQREALLLAKYHGFSYAEIAEMVGVTEVAVKQRVYRALKTLAEEEP